MKRIFAFATTAALLVSASTRADAYCRTTTCNTAECPHDDNGCPSKGSPVVWAQAMPLTFRFQVNGSALLVPEEARAAVRAAFFRWTDVICENGGRTSLRFVEGEDLVPDKPLTVDGAPVGAVSPFGIYFRDHGWPHPESNGDGVLALTTVAFGTQSGRVVYADIEINTGAQPLATNDATTGIDLQTVVTHEVGHYIGLAHSRAENAIMNANLCANSDRCQRDKIAARRLGDDDRAAVCALFPPGATFSAPPKNDDKTCAASPGPHPARTGLVVSLAFLTGALVRRRRSLTARR